MTTKQKREALAERIHNVRYDVEGYHRRGETVPEAVQAEMDAVSIALDAADLTKMAADFTDWKQRPLPDDGPPPPPPVPFYRGNGDIRETDYDAWKRERAAITEGPGYREALTAYLRASLNGGMVPQRHQDVLAGGIDELGGFLLTEDVVSGIFGRRATPSNLFDAVAHRFTTRESVTIKTWQKHATSPSNYSSQNVPVWVAETPSKTAGVVTPKVGQVRIPVQKARLVVPMSRDELSDVDFDLIAEIQRDAMPNARAFFDSAILKGTGVDQPLGMFSDTAIIDNSPAIDVSGTTADTISNTTTNLGSATKIMDLQAALPVQYLPRAVWLMSPDTRNKIAQLIDGNSRFIWGAGLGQVPATLLGHPVVVSPWIDNDGVDGNQILIFGDMEAAYQLVIREEIAAQIDPFTNTNIEQVDLYLRFRLGGHTKQVDAVRVGKV